ncbi:hypothetical protein SPRG_19792 [Saprolegnia parasitica CBS 223.65]|uniref:J domain-containing protein n=1 Tax=Saprolegnia parasitica (strain CBS 223.65) TaxID=695850 RepID=A0A067CTY9_SAPPC|nr:hypothetical protein SPRG_19792 [Saprolegnia parasitica CBS 223.65]KDO30237.1 hypothetical protein SPRG_19792 [Saprolegnia parasitica CBS 223.65]|eukprot:XP_012199045.1 hypothetical protein SPRG_19792 [Saprolegnia parasitica CBS 223.65]
MASSTMDAVEASFGQRDLYAILGVKASATPAQLKTAYRKKALKYHPDKNPDDDDATTKFQLLCTIHAALSNPELRAVYEETGELETEATETSSFRDWVDYWRNLFPKVTTKDIQSFEKTYRESDEEAQDVLQAYEKYKGKMQSILDVVMLSTDDDIDRFTKIIQDAIDANEVPLYPAFTKKIKTKGKSKKAAAEAKAAEELLAQIRGNQAAALSKRQQGFASLLAKYADEKPPAKSGKKKKGRDDDDEPSEEAFQAAQQRLLHKKKKKTT